MLLQGHGTVNSEFIPGGLQNPVSLHTPRILCILWSSLSIIETLWLRWFACSLPERCSINVYY